MQSPHQGGQALNFNMQDTTALVRERVEQVRKNASNIHFEIHKIQQRVAQATSESNQSEKDFDEVRINLPKPFQKSKPQAKRHESDDDEEPGVPYPSPRKKLIPEQQESAPQRKSVLSNELYAAQISEISNFESFAPN